MERKIVLVLIAILSLAIIFVGCEGPMGPQGDPGVDGIDGDDGQDGEEGADGEDGNANVSLYIVEGFDFSSYSYVHRYLHNVTKTEMEQSAWLIYLFNEGSEAYYQLPGVGIANQSSYFVYRQWVTSSSIDALKFTIVRDEGTGEEYDEIHIIQIQANEVIDTRSMSVSSESLIPDGLDTTDYSAVVEYYGIE